LEVPFILPWQSTFTNTINYPLWPGGSLPMFHRGAISAALGDTRGTSAAALGPDAVRHGSVGEVSPRDQRQSRTVVREGLTSIVATLVQ